MCGTDCKWYVVICDNTMQMWGNLMVIMLMVVFSFVGYWPRMCMHGLMLSVSKLGKDRVSSELVQCIKCQDISMST